MKNIWIFALLIVLGAQAMEHECVVEVKEASILCLPAETMELYIQDADAKHYIGEISVVCLASCLSWYVLYGFYIKNEYRHKGYGRWLGHYALNRLINDKHVKKIYVQPGPFEANSQGIMYNLSGPEREERLRVLLEKYQQAGFYNVNRSFARVVQVLYCILGIEENADYLLVYSPQSSKQL